MSSQLERLIQGIGQGQRLPVYLVGGDRVLSEPAARRLADTLAQADGVEVTVHRRPTRISSILDDLRTMSLFAPGKVLMVVESGLFADRASAADLVDQAAEWGDSSEGGLSARGREAASSLLQALRLFGLDPLSGEPAVVLGGLPGWAFEGGSGLRKKRRGRGRGKKQVRDLVTILTDLLAAAREAGLSGWSESDPAALGDILDRGLPERHTLVLAESLWARDHPIAARLVGLGAVVDAGALAVDRKGGISGLDLLAVELERETATTIEPRALQELARRTIKKSSQRGSYDTIDADSSARLAAEYRKLAGSTGPRIELDLVRSTVEDRGEEDVWALLDDLGAGRGGPALERLKRIELAASDSVASRLSLFALVADYCRQLVAVHGLLRVQSVPAGESNYQRFKNRWAPALQSDLPGGLDNPIARLHPYRLHRVYLAASRLDARQVAGLPDLVLLTEARIKGESGDPASALAALMATLAAGSQHRATRRAGR